jgi:hypothetical protein
MTDDLRTIFEARYDNSSMRALGPYASEPAPPSPSPNDNTDDDDDDDKWVVPVAATLGTVGGLAIVGLIAWCLWRKRRQDKDTKQLKRHSQVTDNTAVSRGFIGNWLRGTHAADPNGKDMASEILTETEGPVSARPEMTQNRHPSELEAAYHSPGATSRWSTSTVVRPPPGGDVGPHEVDARSTGLYEAHSRPSLSSSTGYPDSDLRQHPLHPPSVVSGGHAGSDASGPISHPSATNGSNSNGNTSPSASAIGARSPHIHSIPEAAGFALDGHDLTPGSATPIRDVDRPGAVSPVISDSGRQRPSHRRQGSSMSSIPSPLPSPNENPNPNQTV